MEYQIDYAGGSCHNFAHGKKNLIEWLQMLRDETVSDIKKLYKNGRSISVLEQYKKYVGNGR